VSDASIYLSGNFAPLVEEITEFDLAVTGTIPAELEGRLVRNGSNPAAPVDQRTYHWFAGTGMVHGVRIRDGKAEWYRNRFVRDDLACDVRGWPLVGGPRERSGPVNTHVIAHAGRTLAVHEAGPLPIELSYELGTVRHFDFERTLKGPFTAHAKADPSTGQLHAVTYRPDWDHIRYLTVGVDGQLTRTVAVPVPERIAVHDCAITETVVVLFDLPLTLDTASVEAGLGFPYRWNSDHVARIGLLARDGTADDIAWFEIEPCFIYHTLNAYDLEDGSVVLDAVRHPTTMAIDVHGPMDGPPTFDRWTFETASGIVRRELLDDRPQEFPRHDERRTGRAHRYGYTQSLDPFGALIKHDLANGSAELHDFGPGRAAQEPVFVPRAEGASEDDGWIMTYVHDAGLDRSDVVILAAQDFSGEPLATIQLPQRVPIGFHGSWIPDTAVAPVVRRPNGSGLGRLP
jgi:carotenoid cleavage dioxygenase-like enzyme